MIANIALAVLFLVIPAIVMWFCERVKLIRQIGPVLVCYIIGIVIGNSTLLPEGAASIQEILCTITAPLAIPMMLFSCDFRKFSVKTSLVAAIVGVVSVVITVVVGYFIFGKHLGSEGPAIAGSLVGTFTGGQPNLVALQRMLHLPEERFLIISTFDMLICFVYLVFLMSAGIKIGRKWLGRSKGAETEFSIEDASANPYRDFLNEKAFIQLLKILGSTLLLVAVSFAFATIAKSYNPNIFELVMFLSLTTLSLIFATWREVKSWDKSYDAGMYLVYVFSVVVASRADLSTINFEGSMYLFLYQLFGVSVSLLLTLLIGKFCKLDGDTAIITSNTMINSPILVPMVAASMKNRDMIIVGISIGLLGYAIGNYIGYLIFLALGGSL